MVEGTNEKGRYADVHGLSMYYEIHGKGQPLVLLPGTTHVTLMDCASWLLSMISTFLDARMAEG